MKPGLIFLGILVLAAVGCGGSLDQRYLDASVGQSLVIPPDLEESDTQSSFELPSAFAGNDAEDRDRVPVLASVNSMRLENQSGLYWLSVEEPAENLYQLVKSFWATEGYRLIIDEPVIGVMQTEWIYREVGGVKQESWWQSLFSGSDLSASQDQFKTRIERDEENNRSRIYIVHRGTEYVHVLQKGDEFNTSTAEIGDEIEWDFRQPEPELEIEMLSRLMVYLGLEKSRVEQHLLSAKLFEPRASMHFDVDEASPYLILHDAYHIAWNRVYHQLERLNFDIDKAEFSEGLLEEGYFIVNTRVAAGEADTGFFSFGSTEAEERQLVLVLYEENHQITRMDIETIDGEYDQSPEGNEFLKLIFQNIK